MSHEEKHRSHRIGWLRAAVLGANDGIVSNGSLIVGVAAANATQESIILAGVAGLVAGAMSMAAGEYVSVSSQSDTEKADLAIEKKSLEDDFAYELDQEQSLAPLVTGAGLRKVAIRTSAERGSLCQSLSSRAALVENGRAIGT